MMLCHIQIEGDLPYFLPLFTGSATDKNSEKQDSSGAIIVLPESMLLTFAVLDHKKSISTDQ